MIGNIIGIILLILLVLFTISSCIVSSWADDEIEKQMLRRDKDEKKDL